MQSNALVLLNMMQIQATALCKSFGHNNAVVNLSVCLEKGQIIGLLGSNGAGKSTLIKMLAGVVVPDSGDAYLDGHSIVNDRLGAQRHIGYLPELVNGFDTLQVGEFLLFSANARGFFMDKAKQSISRVVQTLELKSVLSSQLGRLSKGWRQRVWLAQSLMHGPSILFLDEPTDGLDPVQKLSIRAVLKSIVFNKTILMSTHILEEAEALCDQLIIMNKGRLVAYGPTSDFLNLDGRIEPKIMQLIGSSSEVVLENA